MKEINDERIDTLFKAVLELKTVDECRRFFTDLCTISELKDKNVYTDIAAKTGASTATISRVNRCINYGSDGYNLVIDRMENKDE